MAVWFRVATKPAGELRNVWRRRPKFRYLSVIFCGSKQQPRRWTRKHYWKHAWFYVSVSNFLNSNSKVEREYLMWAEKDAAHSRLAVQKPLDIFVCATKWNSRKLQADWLWLFVSTLLKITRFIDNVCWGRFIFPIAILQNYGWETLMLCDCDFKTTPRQLNDLCLCWKGEFQVNVFLRSVRNYHMLGLSKRNSCMACLLLLIVWQVHTYAVRERLRWSERQPLECINTHCLSLCFVFYTSLHFYHLLPNTFKKCIMTAFLSKVWLSFYMPEVLLGCLLEKLKLSLHVSWSRAERFIFNYIWIVAMWKLSKVFSSTG